MKKTWTITVPGHRPFSMGGEAMTEAEALHCARLIWQFAEVK